jgi:type II secretory pathway pseudopilin PulG
VTTTRDARPGITLLEVLVAIFIVAIGLLALLTLFPLGALRMGQALKDDRTSQLALTADGYLRAHWRGSVVAELKKLPTNPLDPPNPGNPDPLIWAMDDPNLLQKQISPASRKGSSFWENHYPNAAFSRPVNVQIPQNAPAFISPLSLVPDTYVGSANDTPALTGAQLADPSGHAHYVTAGAPTNGAPSYPVMIDPLGYNARIGRLDQRWVGDTGAPNFIPIPRRNLCTSTTSNTNTFLSYQMNSSGAIQTCCLTDDFTFAPNGSAYDPNTGGTSRQGRYSWAAVVQRPNNTARDVATLKVMVFDNRPPLLATPGDEVIVSGGLVTIDPVTRLGPRSINLSVPNRGADQTPLIRKGGWIMDGTIDNANGIRHANFYRVVGVTEGGADPSNPNNTLYALDLETEIRRTDGQTAPYVATIYLFAGLAEVFERPALQPDPNQ